MKRNFISLGTLEAMGFKFSADKGVLKVSQGNRVVLKAELINNLYCLQGSTVIGTTTISIASNTSNTKLWHMRLGHMSEKGMHLLHKRGYLNDIGKLKFCEHCVFGKQNRVSFSLSTHCTKGILDYIHSDLWGRAPHSSIGGCDYMIIFIDDFSREVWVYFLKHKNDALTPFKQWKALVENQIGRKIKKLRTDNGLEFCNSEFNYLCADHGIARQKTVPGTPPQNGVAERMNRTILEHVRCMLSNAGLWDKHGLWAKAANAACYLINRSPNSGIDFKIPEEVWTSKPVDYSNLRIFGYPAYAHVNNGKLVPRAQKCTFIGYGSGVKGYYLLCANFKKVIVSHDVTFDESTFSSSGGVSDIGSSSTSMPETTDENLEVVVPINVDSVTPITQSVSAFVPPVSNNHSIAQDRPRRNIVLPH
jgi:hypothetical protein